MTSRQSKHMTKTAMRKTASSSSAKLARKSSPLSTPKEEEDGGSSRPGKQARVRGRGTANHESDRDDRPVEQRQGELGEFRRVAAVKRLRWKLNMSQAAFAKAYGIPLGTLKDWEQHRRDPDAAARSYLKAIAAEPEAIRDAIEA